ncbi:calycin-like domain-containing protein [uncultured Prevotella sp.]|uniref:calycin-like domain-containing protein n=1 Tax=uncultured Prevotella sp. TaxID=159272 RepID=UPI00280515EA|nr:calycin-like domain-containing protein [uncultured Prevotella sp.]
MKKIFTLITVMLVAMSAMAQDLKSTDYHDQLVITIEGNTMPAGQAVITITEEAEEGKYTIKLNQFSFNGMLIGDVTMNGVQGDDDSEGFTNYATVNKDDEPITLTATITNGDPLFMGMLGGKVDVTVKKGSRSKDGKLYAMITLVVPGVGNVDAVFGDNNFDGSSINGVSSDDDKVAAIYALNGARVSTMTRGVNILKMQSGKTIKVFNRK